MRYYHRTQQYSITALTGSSGTIKERYAYDAYGGLSIFDGSGTARTSSAEGNRYTYTGREWDEELELYYYRARMYDSVLGRFLSRDPISYYGSRFLLYGYSMGSPSVFIDPSGLTPSVCSCQPGQADSTSVVNSIIQQVIDAAANAPGATPQDIQDAIAGALIGGPGSGLTGTGIEFQLEQMIDQGGIEGEKCQCKVGGGLLGYFPNSASAIKLCGQCVGTDKVGHFLEEGLVYHNIAQQLGTDYAIAYGYWTEGLAPPDSHWNIAIWYWLTNDKLPSQQLGPSFGTIPLATFWTFYSDQGDGVGTGVFDPNGSASPADLASNHSGMLFWDELHGSAVGGFQFDICKYMNGMNWDHTTPGGQNVPGAPRGSNPPPRPLR